MGMKQVLVVMALFAFQVWWCYGCLEEERIALLQFKASVDHLFDELPDWIEDGNCCNWTSVTCDNTTGRIIELRLDGIRDHWTVPDAAWYLNTSLFLSFKEIKIVALSSNGIDGVVGNNGFERLSVLTSLEYLDLSNNHFDASILSSLCTLSCLKRLFLQGNNIEGSVNIEELNNLTTLKELNLASNAIQRFKSFKELQNLDTLYMYGCSLDKNVFQSLRSLLSLRIWDKSEVEGTLHVEGMPSLKNLERLVMSDSNISNNFLILRTIGRMSSLKHLELSNTTISGTIPTTIEEHPKEWHNLEHLKRMVTRTILYFVDRHCLRVVVKRHCHHQYRKMLLKIMTW